MRILSDLLGTLQRTFRIGQATLDADDLTAARAFALPDASGTFALRSDVTPSTTQAGTTYGLVLADAETEVRLTNGAGCAVTVPNSSTQAFATNATILLTAEGAASSLVAASGVTIDGAGLVIPLHAGVTLRYRGSNVWRAIGASA